MIDMQAAFLSLLLVPPIMCAIHETAPHRALVTGSVADQSSPCLPPRLLRSEIHLRFPQAHTSHGLPLSVRKCSRYSKTDPLLGDMGSLSQLIWLEVLQWTEEASLDCMAVQYTSVRLPTLLPPLRITLASWYDGPPSLPHFLTGISLNRIFVQLIDIIYFLTSVSQKTHNAIPNILVHVP